MNIGRSAYYGLCQAFPGLYLTAYRNANQAFSFAAFQDKPAHKTSLMATKSRLPYIYAHLFLACSLLKYYGKILQAIEVIHSGVPKIPALPRMRLQNVSSLKVQSVTPRFDHIERSTP